MDIVWPTTGGADDASLAALCGVYCEDGIGLSRIHDTLSDVNEVKLHIAHRWSVRDVL